MAILRGEAARQWLAQNPNKAYKDLTTGTSVPRQQSGIERFLYNMSKPVRTFLPAVQESVYTLQDLVRAGKGDWRSAERPERYLGMTEEESTAFREDPLKQGLKAGSALISYGMPTGPAASAATPGARIASAAGRSAIPGAMSGFGYSGEGEELSGTLTGGALGGLIGGATQGIGEASRAIRENKLARNLAKKADDFEVQAYTKRVGSKPTMGQGKYDLARDSLGLTKAKGVKINGADDLYAFSDDLFKEYGPVASRYAQQFDEIGGAIPVDKIKQPLLEKLSNTKTGELRKPIQRVLDSIDEAVGGSKTISANDLLQLRREWGNLGNWNKLTPTKEQAVAKAWEMAYSGANDALDDAFKSVGLGDFREVNDILKTAIGQQNWARRTVASRSGQQVWTDLAQDATMFGTALGGGPGSLAGFAASKGLQRYGEDIASKGLRGASKVAGGSSALRGILPGMANVAQRATPAIVGAAQSLPGRQPEAPQEGLGSMLPPQEQGPQIDQLALIEAVLNGQISTSEADWLMEMLGGGAGGQAMPKTDSGRKAMVARDAALQALNILEQDPSAAGKLQGVENVFYDITGQANTATEYKTQIEGLRSQVFNALGGTALSPTEKAQYEKFLPKQNDSPAQAKQKLQILIPMMEALMGAEVDTQPQDGSALYQMLYGAQ